MKVLKLLGKMIGIKEKGRAYKRWTDKGYVVEWRTNYGTKQLCNFGDRPAQAVKLCDYLNNRDWAQKKEWIDRRAKDYDARTLYVYCWFTGNRGVMLKRK